MANHGSVASKFSRVNAKIPEYEEITMDTGDKLLLSIKVKNIHSIDGKVAEWKLKWSLTNSEKTKRSYESYLKTPGAYERSLSSGRNNIQTLQRCKDAIVEAFGKDAVHLSKQEIVDMILNQNQDNNDMSIDEDADMSIDEDADTELSGSLYTPSTTSSCSEMDIDCDSDVSSYHPQREVRIMAKTHHGYDDETSSLGSSVMSVEMEDESEYSDSEEEMEVGF